MLKFSLFIDAEIATGYENFCVVNSQIFPSIFASIYPCLQELSEDRHMPFGRSGNHSCQIQKWPQDIIDNKEGMFFQRENLPFQEYIHSLI